MTLLLDSDWVMDWLTGTARARAMLHSLRRERLAISAMTYGEIYEGIYFGRDPVQAEQVFLNFLRTVDVLPLSRRVLRCFARIRGDLRSKGQLIGDPDLLIAATAIYHEFPLVTRNRTHFSRISDLVLYEANA
jgi:tRNA(fMet)-specific endonuclease VapC